jgi:hypothetical protein
MIVLGCRFSEEDQSMVIEWYDDMEQKQEGGIMYQTIITAEALQNWKHVNYYAKELHEDLQELISWTEKYRSGVYED